MKESIIPEILIGAFIGAILSLPFLAVIAIVKFLIN